MPWRTWAGFRTNATLTSALAGLTDPMQEQADVYSGSAGTSPPAQWRSGTADAADRLCLPEVDEKALTGLKVRHSLTWATAERGAEQLISLAELMPLPSLPLAKLTT
ncbi:hypothetical protein AAH979_20745 [Plantactinospora sp. ZYX-F-223]|uniref:hypothetical protein n=1 Tax=Plantactinospora sp. ZYX-F-223 TaxID=3144103 RepID=UPI0031FCE688